jgi:hypothetical protein
MNMPMLGFEKCAHLIRIPVPEMFVWLHVFIGNAGGHIGQFQNQHPLWSKQGARKYEFLARIKAVLNHIMVGDDINLLSPRARASGDTPHKEPPILRLIDGQIEVCSYGIKPGTYGLFDKGTIGTPHIKYGA